MVEGVEADAKPTLYVHDSERSSQSSVRDAFISSLRQQVETSSDTVAGLVEVGVYEIPEAGKFMPMEHLAYASRNVPAITLTVRDPSRMPTSRTSKFSLLDTDLCLCKLSKLMFLLTETMAQTIASPDLQIQGQFFGSEGIKKSDKMYLK